MKILLGSHAFHPMIGGIESCSLALAEQFQKLGHQVKIVTQTPSSSAVDDLGFDVCRRPSWKRMYSLLRWCDVFWQNNITIRSAWLALILRTPLAVTTQTWVRRSDGIQDWTAKVKLFTLRFVGNIHISQAIADHVGFKGIVIPNPYNSDLFRNLPNIPKAKDLVFLGRLVSDKGCELLIEALGLLLNQGHQYSLTVVGAGPEDSNLRTLAIRAGVASQVHFTGSMQGGQLVEELNQHRVMVVPSLWAEPFGIVALEGMACGCVVVGSSGGGLREAIGPCGEIFESGNAEQLAAVLLKLLNDESVDDRYISKIPDHLAARTGASIAGQYLKFFESFIADRARH